MNKMGIPSKAEIAENRRRLAMDYAIRVPAVDAAEAVKNAKAIEAYLAGKKQPR